MKTAGGREDLISLAGQGPSSLAGCRHGPGSGRASWEEPAGPAASRWRRSGHELAGSGSRGGLGWQGNLINGMAMARVLGGRGSRWQIAKPVLHGGRKEPKLG